MTAPYTGPSPAQKLFQTIVTLRELRQRDEAAQLAREQFGLQQAQFGLTQEEAQRQAGMQQESGLAALQTIRSNVKDVNALLPHTGALSRMIGAPEDVVTSILQATPSSAGTTRNVAVEQGAQQLGGSLNKEAAAGALTGENLGGVAASGLHEQIFNGAQQFLKSLPPDQQQQFQQRVLERVGSGMTPADATLDTLFQHAPKPDQERVMQIARQIAPSASTEIQASIANRQLALDYSKQSFDESARTLQLDIMKAEASARLHGKDPETESKIINLLDLYNKNLTDFEKSSVTLNPTGRVVKAQGLNSLVDELKKLSPEQFTPEIVKSMKIPLGQTPAATSPLIDFLGKFIR